MKQKLLMLAMLFVAFAMGATAQDDNVTVVLDENFDSFTEGSEDEPATTDISSYSSGKLSKKLTGWSGSKVYEALRNAKVRCEFDARNEKIGYMIREAQVVGRVPYMLIIGQKEAETGTVSVRNRDTAQTETMTLDAFIEKITTEINQRI